MKKSKIVYLWKKYPDYKRLQLSSIYTGLGSWISFIGMLVLLNQITSNGFQLGLLWAISGLAPILFSMFTGVFVDKVNLRKLIYRMDFLNTFLLLIYILIPYMEIRLAWILFFVTRFLIGIANSFASVASQKAVRNIVIEDDLILANSLSYTITSIIRLIGASIGGVIVSFLELEMVWIVAAILYGISAINIFLCKWKQISSVKSDKNFKDEFLIGLNMVQKNRLVGLVLFSAVTLGIIIGTFNLILQEYVTEIYEMNKYGISILYCTEGLVAIIVGYIVAEKKLLFKNKRRYSLFYAMVGLGWVLFSFTDNVYQGMLSLFIFSIGTTILAPYERYIMQTQVPYEVQGRVFGLWSTVTTISIQLGALFTGIIIETLGVTFVPLLSGLCQILMAIVFCFLLNHSYVKVISQPNISKESH